MSKKEQEKIIVRKDKNTGEVVVFWLEERANYGRICSNDVISSTNLMSMSEASLGYYNEDTKKASPEEVEMAVSAVKASYDVDAKVMQRLQYKQLLKIWAPAEA